MDSAGLSGEKLIWPLFRKLDSCSVSAEVILKPDNQESWRQQKGIMDVSVPGGVGEENFFLLPF